MPGIMLAGFLVEISTLNIIFLHSAKACWPSRYKLQWSPVVVWD